MAGWAGTGSRAPRWVDICERLRIRGQQRRGLLDRLTELGEADLRLPGAA
jgi:hypothetical protein